MTANDASLARSHELVVLENFNDHAADEACLHHKEDTSSEDSWLASSGERGFELPSERSYHFTNAALD